MRTLLSESQSTLLRGQESRGNLYAYLEYSRDVKEVDNGRRLITEKNFKLEYRIDLPIISMLNINVFLHSVLQLEKAIKKKTGYNARAYGI